MILLGFGAGIAFNPMLLAAMSDVAPRGGRARLGRRQHRVHDGRRARPRDPREPRRLPHRQPARSGASTLAALNGGYHAAFLVGALFAAAAAAVGGIFLPRSRRTDPHGAHAGELATASD